MFFHVYFYRMCNGILQVMQLILGVLSMVFGFSILIYAVENDSYSYYGGYPYWNYFYSDYYAVFSTGIWTGIFVSCQQLYKYRHKFRHRPNHLNI